MKIHVRHYQGFGELIVSEGNSQFETGFLSPEEREEVAGDLLQAVSALIERDFEDREAFLEFVNERV